MPISVPGDDRCRTRAFSDFGRPQPFRRVTTVSAGSLVDDLPDVPALPETLLQMELRLHDFSIDLHELSQLILSDVGATLQILRLAARECSSADGRPTRIEDCISHLGHEACLRVAGRRTVLSEARHRGVIEVWAHSREVAQLCRKLAGADHGSIHPEEAYLVGLTHTLGALPAILGWQGPQTAAPATGWTKGSDWPKRGRCPPVRPAVFRRVAAARLQSKAGAPRAQGTPDGPHHPAVSDVRRFRRPSSAGAAETPVEPSAGPPQIAFE